MVKPYHEPFRGGFTAGKISSWWSPSRLNVLQLGVPMPLIQSPGCHLRRVHLDGWEPKEKKKKKKNRSLTSLLRFFPSGWFAVSGTAVLKQPYFRQILFLSDVIFSSKPFLPWDSALYSCQTTWSHGEYIDIYEFIVAHSTSHGKTIDSTRPNGGDKGKCD